MAIKDKEALIESVLMSEESFDDEEKKTLSIRLSASTINKIQKRVEKLKSNNKIRDKHTVSSYVSKIIDDFARYKILETGSFRGSKNGE